MEQEEKEIMFCFRVPNDIIAHSFKLAASKNYGRRHEANGTFEEQVRGLIGQNMVLRQFGLPPMQLSDEFDGGIDLAVCGKTFDVKTMGRSVDPKPDFVNNFIAHQKSFSPDGYIFLSLNIKNWVLTYCGWADQDTFSTYAKWFAKGQERTRTDGTTFLLKANTYEIENKHLIDSYSFQEMFSQIIRGVNDPVHFAVSAIGQ